MKPTPDAKTRIPNKSTLRHEREAELAVAGAVAGAALGAVAGPPGAAVGALVGAIGGAVAGVASARGSELEGAHDRELDDEIGLNGEGLGAPGLEHPPARVGAYSSGSSGSSAPSSGHAPASGPLGGSADE